MVEFVSSDIQKAYDAHGYAVTPLIDQQKIQQLAGIFSKYFSTDGLPSVYDTIAMTEAETIAKVNEEINQVCSEDLSKLLTGFRIVCSIFFIKKPGADSHLSLHVDTSLTVPPHHAMGIWIPLCDIDETTGRFCVLEKSEHYLPPYNTPSIPYSYNEVESMLDPYLTCLSMRAGDALIMNNSLLHATQKNTSDKTRVAVVIKVVDETAPLVTTYYDETAEPGKKVKLYKQSNDFFTTGKFRSAVPPEGAEFVSYVPELPKVFSKEEILELLEKYPVTRS